MLLLPGTSSCINPFFARMPPFPPTVMPPLAIINLELCELRVLPRGRKPRISSTLQLPRVLEQLLLKLQANPLLDEDPVLVELIIICSISVKGQLSAACHKQKKNLNVTGTWRTYLIVLPGQVVRLQRPLRHMLSRDFDPSRLAVLIELFLLLDPVLRLVPELVLLREDGLDFLVSVPGSGEFVDDGVA